MVRRRRAGRQNFFFIFVVLIPERVTRSTGSAFGLVSLGKNRKKNQTASSQHSCRWHMIVICFT